MVLGLSIAGFVSIQQQHPHPQPPDASIIAAELGCTDLRVDRTVAHAAESAKCSFAGGTVTITTFTDTVNRDRWLADGAGIDEPHTRVVGDLWVVMPSSPTLVPAVVARVGGHIE